MKQGNVATSVSRAFAKVFNIDAKNAVLHNKCDAR